MLRRASGEIAFAIPFQCLARFADHRGAQRRFRRQIGEEIIRQIHQSADWGLMNAYFARPDGASRCSRFRIAYRHGRPASDITISSTNGPIFAKKPSTEYAAS